MDVHFFLAEKQVFLSLIFTHAAGYFGSFIRKHFIFASHRVWYSVESQCNCMHIAHEDEPEQKWTKNKWYELQFHNEKSLFMVDASVHFMN